MEERVQKILSNYGYASRRKAEDLIRAGKVKVNDKVIKLGDKADPEKDIIKIEGEKIRKNVKKIYMALFKPRFYVVSTVPEPGKKSIFELLKNMEIKERIYPVGRLDYDTEGLILLTNDGDFANKVMHPRYELEKTYLAKTKEPLIDNSIRHINEGVNIGGRKVLAKAKIVNRENHMVEITLHEGRKHIVKRLLFKLGYLVVFLRRIKIGNIGLGDLKPGEWRYLRMEEVEALKKAVNV